MSRIRFEKNHSNLPGSPDFVIGKKVIFVDGCFWHCCRKHWKMPKTNKKFWLNKFKNNFKRDKRNNKDLMSMGYKVIRIWECKLRKDPESIMKRVKRLLKERNFKGVTHVPNHRPKNPEK